MKPQKRLSKERKLMKTKFYLSILSMLIGIFCFNADTSAELKIDSVYPTTGINGRDLPTTITGSGFDANTRVSMYPYSEKAIIGSLKTSGYNRGIAISGSLAYLATEKGLQVVDVGNPRDPKIIGSADMPDGARRVSISGTTAYLTTKGGLRIVDIADPRNPRIIGSANLSDTATGVAISGGFAYLTEGMSNYTFKLRIIDIRNPEKPEIVGSVDLPKDVGLKISVSGSFAYLSDYKGLHIVNISDPSKPEIVGFVKMPYNIYGFSVSGSIAYVACDYPGLFLIADIADPQNPKIIGVTELGNVIASAVSVSGSTAYVASDNSLQIIDLNLIPFPTLGMMFLPDDVKDISVSDNLAYVLDFGGFRIIDFGNPENPEIIGEVKYPYVYLGQILLSGSMAYVSSQENLIMPELSLTS
jgi:hypothetical protein